MTNAQAALQAAATSLGYKWTPDDIISARAAMFKDWLDEQDEIDRKRNQLGATRTYGEV